MSRRDDHTSIGDMLNHARKAVDLLRKTNREQFEDNRTLQFALTRLIQIVGEAANRVSKTTQGRHPELPWHKIVGMRNRLIHGYDVTDTDMRFAFEKFPQTRGKKYTLSIRTRLVVSAG